MHLQIENQHSTSSKYILHFKDDWFCEEFNFIYELFTGLTLYD